MEVEDRLQDNLEMLRRCIIEGNVEGSKKVVFFFSEFYIQTIQDRFLEVEKETSYSEASVFSTILTEAGKKEMTNSKNPLEAIHAEACNTCLTNNWNGMVQMMALTTVSIRPIFRIDFL